MLKESTMLQKLRDLRLDNSIRNVIRSVVENSTNVERLVTDFKQRVPDEPYEFIEMMGYLKPDATRDKFNTVLASEFDRLKLPGIHSSNSNISNNINGGRRNRKYRKSRNSKKNRKTRNRKTRGRK